ncbi:hypothetical protein [Halorientalis marina]|uniref:hypothetical protein n=1 Tax=Halorientalis marina TaxID=2931976 RepID=UPI001FF55C5F|nr:hypothetical protein [Halorientalis marina]
MTSDADEDIGLPAHEFRTGHVDIIGEKYQKCKFIKEGSTMELARNKIEIENTANTEKIVIDTAELMAFLEALFFGGEE